MKNHNTPRKPTENEFNQLAEVELAELDQIRRKTGHCSYDEGDLAFMLNNASIAVFDTYNPRPAPGQYHGKLMVVVWGMRHVTQYAWIDGHLVKVSEENKAEIQ
jgi:hypothetical protein